MFKCSYCKRQYPVHKGLTLVLNSGVIVYFCGSKCRKNYYLKRRKVRWVSKGVEAKEVVAAHEKKKADNKAAAQ
jgi:ribosomal protein L24E